MATRGALYRCHLFSFTGPQTEGVVSRWTQNLEPIGERVVRTGERVELYTVVEGQRGALGESTKIRFDLLEEDFLLSGGLDDKVLSFVGRGAAAPDEGFAVHPRSTFFFSLAAGEAFADGIRRHRDEGTLVSDEAIVIAAETAASGRRYHVLTWWTAERLEDSADAEIYFIVNIDDEIESTADTMHVSPQRAESAASSVVEAASPLTRARWSQDRARPGDMAELVVEGAGLEEGMAIAVEIRHADSGELVDAFDFVAIGEGPPFRTEWRVPDVPLAAGYVFGASLYETSVVSGLLAITGTLRVRLTSVDGSPLPDVAYALVANDGTTMRQGRTNADGLVIERDVPPTFGELQIDEYQIADVQELTERVAASDLTETDAQTLVVVSAGGAPLS